MVETGSRLEVKRRDLKNLKSKTKRGLLQLCRATKRRKPSRRSSPNRKAGKGQGTLGAKAKGNQVGLFKEKCFNCGGDHPPRNNKEWKEMRQKICSSGN